MNRRMQFTIELRGIQVNVDLLVTPPDRSVGIMGYWFEDEVLVNSAGDGLDWTLTEEETDKICCKMEDLLADEMDQHFTDFPDSPVDIDT